VGVLPRDPLYEPLREALLRRGLFEVMREDGRVTPELIFACRDAIRQVYGDPAARERRA